MHVLSWKNSYNGPSTIQTYIYVKNIPNICVVKCADIVLILDDCDPATGSRD